MFPFLPQNPPASTTSISATTTTSRVAIAFSNPDYARCQVQIINTGTGTVFVAFGDGTVTATVPNGATAGSIPIGAGQNVLFTLRRGETNVAAITASGTATVYVTPGEGV